MSGWGQATLQGDSAPPVQADSVAGSPEAQGTRGRLPGQGRRLLLPLLLLLLPLLLLPLSS